MELHTRLPQTPQNDYVQELRLPELMEMPGSACGLQSGCSPKRQPSRKENAAERREEDKSLLRAHAYELMTSLEENYIKRVVGRKGSVKSQRTSEWEAKARKELANFAEESEITAFIHDIEGRYYRKSSDGTYTTLYGDGYEDDSDDEDDEDDDYDDYDDDY